MNKLLFTVFSSVLSLGLTGLMAAQPPGRDDGPPPPKAKKKGDAAKKKGEPGPAGDLRRAYDLLWKVKADTSTSGRGQDRLRDWTERATALYRKGVRAYEAGDPRLAHEYGAASHDLACAIDHSRNASRFDRPDPDLPPPPEGPGPEADAGRARHDLRRAYDRIRESGTEGPDARFYLDAARDLYNAARRDAERGRPERAGELARASEAITHVPEHLAHAADRDFETPRPKPEPTEPPKGSGERPRADDELPPPLPPRESR